MSRYWIGGICSGLLVVGVVTGLAGRPPSESAVQASVVFSGAGSKITKARYVRVDDEAAWVKLWEEHTGLKVQRSNIAEPMDFPRVNFDSCMVVGCFKGAGHNSSGVYAVAIDETADSIRLRFDEWTYQTFGEKDGGAVKVSAYGIFVLPKSAKKVVIEENTQGLKDNPAKWTLRGEFGPAPKAQVVPQPQGAPGKTPQAPRPPMPGR